MYRNVSVAIQMRGCTCCLQLQSVQKLLTQMTTIVQHSYCKCSIKPFFVSTIILYLSLSFKQEKAHHDFSPWGLQIPSPPKSFCLSGSDPTSTLCPWVCLGSLEWSWKDQRQLCKQARVSRALIFSTFNVHIYLFLIFQWCYLLPY